MPFDSAKEAGQTIGRLRQSPPPGDWLADVGLVPHDVATADDDKAVIARTVVGPFTFALDV